MGEYDLEIRYAKKLCSACGCNTAKEIVGAALMKDGYTLVTMRKTPPDERGPQMMPEHSSRDHRSIESEEFSKFCQDNDLKYVYLCKNVRYGRSN